MAILQDILLPSFVRGVVSRIKQPASMLSRRFGFQIDGPNVDQVEGRVYTYDIYDNVRTLTNARLPSAPAGTVAPNPVGNNTVGLAQFKERLPLDYNQLARIRTLGQNAGQQDRMGGNYIDRQAGTLRQRADNVREFLAGALFQGGKYAFYQYGDDLIPTYDTSGVFLGIDLKIDAGNLALGSSYANAVANNNGGNGLTLGTGSNLIPNAWSDLTNGNAVRDVLAISSAFQDIVGAPLGEVWCGSDVWQNVLQQTAVRQLAGTAASPFAAYTMTPDVGPDGTPTGLQIGRLKALDWIDWYIYDGSLSIASGSATTFSNVKLLPRNTATFMVKPDGRWLRMVEGSEWIADNDWTEPEERFGFYAWSQQRADPARVWYHTFQQIGLELNIPKAIATARVQ